MSFTCEICKNGEEITRWKRCDKHYRCDDCGTKDKLCTYSEGVLCDPCHKIRVDDRIAKFKGDTSYTDEVICPHCGYKHRDSWEMSDGEYECPDCQNTYEIERYVQVSYSTSKMQKPVKNAT